MTSVPTSDGGACLGGGEFPAKPFGLYMMVERASWMVEAPAGATHAWGRMVDALARFLDNVGDLSVGVQYFGEQAAPSGNPLTMCEVSAYATAAVDLADLPDNADPVKQSLGMAPAARILDAGVGETPLSVAIGGAVARVKAWKEANDGLGAVLIATGGRVVSSRCSPEPGAAVEVARAAKQEGVPVFVLDLGGLFDVTHRIAEAGGTTSALPVDDELGGLEQSIRRLRCSSQSPTL